MTFRNGSKYPHSGASHSNAKGLCAFRTIKDLPACYRLLARHSSVRVASSLFILRYAVTPLWYLTEIPYIGWDFPILDSMQRLPTEILVMTFKKVIHCSAPGGHYMSLIQFMLVCRRWRDTLIGDATLWSNITVSGGESIPHALRSVNRSGQSRLTVDLVLSHSTPTDDIHVLLERLADRSHRLASFRMITRSFPSIPPWTSAAINLHTLILRNRGIPQPLNDFIDEPLPRLRHLVLEGFHSWPAGRFRDLHHITLQIPPTHGTVSSTALLGLLTASPELRTFNVSGCKRVLPLPPPSKVVALPHLVLLTIHTSSAHDVLCHMSLPSTVEVRLTKCINTIGDLCEKTSLSYLGDSSSTLSTLAAALDTNQSTIIFRAFKHGRSSPSLVITERLPPGSKNAVTKTLEDYATLPAFTPVEALSVTADGSFQVPWKTWLSSFPALRQLTIRTRDPSAFHTAFRSKFGCYPIPYPIPKPSGPCWAQSIRIDWRATSNLIRYRLTFGGVSSTPFLRKGLVSRMKPRGAVTLGGKRLETTRISVG
jgi:hypothetical protein